MFWGLVLEPSKKYTQKVDQTFHISQAALDLRGCDANPIQLVVEYGNSDFVLATLSKEAKIYQVPLDLIFKTGDQVSFRAIGNGKVHLSGYHVLEDLDSVIMNGEEESDVEELEEVQKEKGKRKKPAMDSKGKKPRLEGINELESDDDDDLEEEDEDFVDDDSDEEEENVSVGKKTGKKNEKGNSLLSSMDDDFDEDFDEDEEEEEDDDDDEDDEIADDDEDEDDEEVGVSDDDSYEVSMKLDTSKKKSGKAESKKGSQTPNGLESGSKAKEKSPQKLNKSLKQGTPKSEAKTLKSETKQKGEKKPGSVNTTTQKQNSEGLKKEEKTPKSPKSEGSPQKKVLEGGVISEEIKVGNGPVVKPGKMVSVYYVGSLASSKKEFDSVQSGGGFKFRVGRNEVIRGWDIGIIGMKVGGKRRLTIPPHLAYGQKGSPPVIPPNSTLVFTVELRGLS